METHPAVRPFRVDGPEESEEISHLFGSLKQIDAGDR